MFGCQFVKRGLDKRKISSKARITLNKSVNHKGIPNTAPDIVIGIG